MKNLVKLNVVLLFLTITFSTESIASEEILPVPRPEPDSETQTQVKIKNYN